MARLIYTAITTLDGYIDGEDGHFDWSAPRDTAERDLSVGGARTALSEQRSTGADRDLSIGCMAPRAAAPAAYDAYADWYNDYISAAAGGEFIQRVHATIEDLLGTGTGTCLDVCCGTGAHAHVLAGLGWTPVGVDLSRGQLRHAAGRLPVAIADATALPLADDALPAAVCVLASTDVPDYAAVLREVARVLRPGGRFVHVGVHPCFTGAFADRSEPSRIVLDERYADRSHSFDAWNPDGPRARVGAWHIPLADLLNAVMDAGMRLARTAEAGAGGIPEVFAFLAVKD